MEIGVKTEVSIMFLVFTIVCISVVIRLLIFPIKFSPEDDAGIGVGLDSSVHDTAASGTTVPVLSSSAVFVEEALTGVMLVVDAGGAGGAKSPEWVALVMRMRNACSKMS